MSRATRPPGTRDRIRFLLLGGPGGLPKPSSNTDGDDGLTVLTPKRRLTGVETMDGVRG